jgi:hypothetical protein
MCVLSLSRDEEICPKCCRCTANGGVHDHTDPNDPTLL